MGTILIPGEKLGHYRIQEKLGSGGMGDVYLAEDTKLKRQIALKILPEEAADTPAQLARFQREARTLATLNHPGIVTIYSVEQVKENHFITMEYAAGTTLSKRIPDEGMPLEEFVEVATPLTRALGAAHQHGVLHRDLKPANIMVSERNEVKILDFGLALVRPEGAEAEDRRRTSEQLTREGEILGTMPYMSPEQIEGTTIDHRSDIYSLGTIFFEMLTGRHPFQGQSGTQLLLAIHGEAPPSIQELCPELPKELHLLIQNCLEKDPEDRMCDADEVLRVLDLIASNFTGPSPSSSTLVATRSSFLRKLARQRRIRVLAAASVVAAAAAVVTFPLYRSQLGFGDPGAEAGGRKIVVLPFENQGPADDEYFAAGISDEITCRLTAVRGLRVISRNSARQYAETDKTTQQIGRELKVDYILSGTARWERTSDGPGRVRIIPQLTRVADDISIWSQKYERVIEDTFAIQTEIADQVMQQLGTMILASDRKVLQARETKSIEAYQHYLRGISSFSSYLVEDTRTAIDMFERATEIDPSFALAYAELSKAHSWLYVQTHDSDRSEHLERARETALRSLELEPALAEGHRSMGYYYYWGMRDFELALSEFSQVAQLLPNDAETLADTAYVMRRRGQFAKSVENLTQLLELDPRSASVPMSLGFTLMVQRDFEAADQAYSTAILRNPESAPLYLLKAWNYWLWDGDPARSRAVLDDMPGQDYAWAQLWLFYQKLYERDFATALQRASATDLEVFSDNLWILPTSTLQCYAEQLIAGLPGSASPAPASCDAAIRYLEQEISGNPDDHRLHSTLGFTYALVGDPRSAEESSRAVELYPISSDTLDGPWFAIDRAKTLAIGGDRDAALELLAELLEIPCALSRPMLELDPAWDSLRDDARFRALVTSTENE